MGKKVEYVRVILTERCNLNCAYCHSEGVVCQDVAKEINADDCISILKVLYLYGIRKIKLMGGEPTQYSGLVGLIREIKKIGDDIDLSIITNGLFDISLIDKCIEAGVNRINVSVHAFSSEESLKMSGMDMDSISILKRNIEYLKGKNKLSKLNYVYLNGQDTQELFDLITWVANRGIVLDVLNYLSHEGKASSNYISFNNIENVIGANFKICEENMIENLYSLPSKHMLLENGAIINLKVESLNSNCPFNQCNICEVRDACIEGIRAIRLIPGNIIKPCLLRDDNVLMINEKDGEVVKEKIFKYLDSL